MKECGAKTRGGGKCKKPAMPNGRCKLHGGKSPAGTDSPHFRHGRYSQVFRQTLAEKFLHASEDAKPLDLLPELAVQRTMLSYAIEQADSKPKPKTEDLKVISSLTEDVVRTAATITKVRNDTALTVAEIRYIQNGMMRLLEKYVTDPNRRRDFIAELSALVPGGHDDSAEPAENLSALTETPSDSV